MLGVLIPALNEEDNIQLVIQGIVNSGIDTENIFVLNNHSTDRTRQIAIKNKCIVIDIESKGYSSTLKVGLSLLKERGYKRFLIVDGDNEIDSSSVKDIITKSLHYQLCCGFRDKPKRIGEKIVNIYFQKKYGVLDYMCGLKLGCLEDFNPHSVLNYGIDLLNFKKIRDDDVLNIKIKLNLRDESRLGNAIKVNFLLIYNLLLYIISARKL
jgi:glycosyltransferase involved in cell wall biosynthesis